MKTGGIRITGGGAAQKSRGFNPFREQRYRASCVSIGDAAHLRIGLLPGLDDIKLAFVFPAQHAEFRLGLLKLKRIGLRGPLRRGRGPEARLFPGLRLAGGPAGCHAA